MPEFAKIGYEIVAITFAGARSYKKKEVEAKLDLTKKWQ